METCAQQLGGAEQPVVYTEHSDQSIAHNCYEKVLASLERNCENFTPAPSLHIPKSDCPLAEHIVNNLAEAACDDEATSVVEELEQLFMFGEVKLKKVPGHWDEEIKDPMQRLQYVLELLKEQRDIHIGRLLNRHDPRLRGGQADFTFTDEDMKEVHNTWRKDPRRWMKQDSLLIWQQMKGDQAHNFLKSRFGAMKFQLLGNEALVDFTIRCNLIGAVQPAALQDFMHRWKQYIETPACRQAQEYSRPKPVGQVQRFRRIKDLREQIERGKWINDWVQEDWNNWSRLTESDRRLCQAYCSYALDDELKAIQATPKGIAFRGAASNIMHRTGVCQ